MNTIDTRGLPATGQQILTMLQARALTDCPGDSQQSFLPTDQIADCVGTTRPWSYILGGATDYIRAHLYLGNMDTVVVPLSWFRTTGRTQPDYEDFEVTDHGSTVRFGRFEASVEAILEEFASPAVKKLLTAWDGQRMVPRADTVEDTGSASLHQMNDAIEEVTVDEDRAYDEFSEAAGLPPWDASKPRIVSMAFSGVKGPEAELNALQVQRIKKAMNWMQTETQQRYRPLGSGGTMAVIGGVRITAADGAVWVESNEPWAASGSFVDNVGLGALFDEIMAPAWKQWYVAQCNDSSFRPNPYTSTGAISNEQIYPPEGDGVGMGVEVGDDTRPTNPVADAKGWYGQVKPFAISLAKTLWATAHNILR